VFIHSFSQIVEDDTVIRVFMCGNIEKEKEREKKGTKAKNDDERDYYQNTESSQT